MRIVAARRRRRRWIGVLVLAVVVLVGGGWAVVRVVAGPDFGLHLSVRRPVDAQPGEAAVAAPLRSLGEATLGRPSTGSDAGGLSGLVSVLPTGDGAGVAVTSVLDAGGGWTLSRAGSVRVGQAGVSSDFGVVVVLWDDGWLMARRIADGSSLWQQRVRIPDASGGYAWAGRSFGLSVVDAESVVITEGRTAPERWIVAHQGRSPVAVQPARGCVPNDDLPITSYAAYLVATCGGGSDQLTAFGVDGGAIQWQRNSGSGSVSTVPNGDLLVDGSPRRTLITTDGVPTELPPERPAVASGSTGTGAEDRTRVLTTFDGGFVVGQDGGSTGRLAAYTLTGTPTWQLTTAAGLGPTAAVNGDSLFTIEGGDGTACSLVVRSVATGRRRQVLGLGAPTGTQPGESAGGAPCGQVILGVAAGRVLVGSGNSVREFG